MAVKQCCSANNKKNGFKQGILYGFLPHTFCIGFILASIVGVTTATSFFRRLLLVPEFFQILVALSLLFATASALIYLKKCGLVSWSGIKSKWKYLVILYSLTVGINLLMFLVVLPVVASQGWGINRGNKINDSQLQKVNLQVKIPCPGHAPLVISELRKVEGVGEVKFKMPNLFEVNYDSKSISVDKIFGLEIFANFPVTKI